MVAIEDTSLSSKIDDCNTSWSLVKIEDGNISPSLLVLAEERSNAMSRASSSCESTIPSFCESLAYASSVTHTSSRMEEANDAARDGAGEESREEKGNDETKSSNVSFMSTSSRATLKSTSSPSSLSSRTSSVFFSRCVNCCLVESSDSCSLDTCPLAIASKSIKKSLCGTTDASTSLCASSSKS